MAKAKKPAARKRVAKKAAAKKPVASQRRKAAGPVEAAVRRDLAGIEKTKGGKGLSRSGLAKSALVLARELDDRFNSATAKASCARALLATFEQLRELAGFAPEKSEGGGDALDKLSAKVEAKRAGGTAT